MNTSTRRRWPAALGLLVATALMPHAPADAESPAPDRADPGAVSARSDPAGTQYIYRGTFDAEVRHSLVVDWGDPDSVRRTMNATVRGTLASLRTDHLGLIEDLAPSTSAVELVSSAVKEVTRSNRGRTVITCVGSAGSVIGPPLVLPDVTLDPTLVPFALMQVTAPCSDDEGRALPPTTFGYGPLTTVVPDLRGLAGNSTISLPFRGAVGVPPLEGSDTCPGHIPGQTPTCEYAIAGTITLELVERILPGTPPGQTEPPDDHDPSDGDEPRPPRKAVVGPGGRWVLVPVTCRRRSTVRITITGLRGGPALLRPRVVRCRPARPTYVKVRIPADRRAVVVKSHGVRITLVVRSGRKTSRHVVKARL